MIGRRWAGAMVAAAVLCTTPIAAAQTETQHSDRTVYRQLIRELKRIDREYAQLLDAALDEARRGGAPDLEREAELLSLRDKRDRTTDRLVLSALRHGWEVPDLSPAEAGEARPTGKAQVFEGSRAIIRAELTDEAEQIAAEVWLPVISMPREG